MTARDVLFAFIGFNIAALSGLLVLVYQYSNSNEAAKAQVVAMKAQLEEAERKAAVDATTAKLKDEEAKAAQERARAAEEAARKSGDVAQNRAIAEARVRVEAAAKAEAEAASAAARAAAAQAAQEAAARIAAAEKAAAARIAAAERAATAPAPNATGEQLFEQAAMLEFEGRGAEAVRTYTRAARSGSGKAAKRLGEIYDKGIPGVPRDYAESLKWYNTARALGEDIKDERRQSLPSSPPPRPSSAEKFFDEAVALEKAGNFPDAARYYRLSARSGNGKAALRLWEIYGKGLPGVEMNYGESLKWCNTARALGEEPKCMNR